MTINELMWKHLVNCDDETEVIAMTLVLKHSDGRIVCCGIDDYGCFFAKEEEQK